MASFYVVVNLQSEKFILSEIHEQFLGPHFDMSTKWKTGRVLRRVQSDVTVTELN